MQFANTKSTTYIKLDLIYIYALTSAESIHVTV